jgi:hypothetical protein
MRQRNLASLAGKLPVLARSVGRDLLWKARDLGAAPVAPGPAPSAAEQDDYRQKGWALLRGAVPEEEIDLLKERIARFRSRAGGGVDEHGNGMRIGLLHAEERQSLRVALNPRARAFLAWAFGGEPVLFGSLTFDIGSEQEAHIDAAFFYTQPDDVMAGCWTALEDIHPESGPLFYIEGSHLWPRQLAADALAEDPGLAARVRAHAASGASHDLALSNQVYLAYIALLHRRIAERGAVKTPALIRKGDIFIWHAWLVHGGLPRADRTRSRRSMVAHFIRHDARFWDQHSFFLHGADLTPARCTRFAYRGSPRGRYIKYHQAVTFPGPDGHFKA